MSRSPFLRSLSARFAMPLLAAMLAPETASAQNDPAAAIRKAVTFYASFDREVKGDFGAGAMLPRTRQDHESRPGEFVFRDGIDSNVFRIARGKGVTGGAEGGALECLDVLPRRGRILFPGAKNLAYRPDGWGGTCSFWMNTDVDVRLKTDFCDPVQITAKNAHDGAIWVDFPKTSPRSMRMGAYTALAPGEKAIPEDDPRAPLAPFPKIALREGTWRHVAITWDRFDTGKPDAVGTLYVDGRPAGTIENRAIAMQWDPERVGIYVAVSYIGLLDEFAVFGRSLTAAEVATLAAHPDLLSPLAK